MFYANATKMESPPSKLVSVLRSQKLETIRYCRDVLVLPESFQSHLVLPESFKSQLVLPKIFLVLQPWLLWFLEFCNRQFFPQSKTKHCTEFVCSWAGMSLYWEIIECRYIETFSISKSISYRTSNIEYLDMPLFCLFPLKILQKFRKFRKFSGDS